MEKRIRSVPVVEANGRVLIGNATSADLADFLRDSADGSRAALPGATVHVRPYGPLHAGP
jgi:CBS domain-containing protein